MAFDLDEDELRATREMHKLSDKNVAKIDDDINKLNKFCEYEDTVVLCEEALYEIQEAIERILSEREQDKKKIKELEGETLLISPYYVKQNYIPKRKVEDELEALRKKVKSNDVRKVARIHSRRNNNKNKYIRRIIRRKRKKGDINDRQKNETRQDKVL